MVTESSKDSENKSETAGETEDNAVYSSVGLQSPKVEQSEVTDGTANGVKATENDSSAITEGTAIKTESGVKSEMETEQGSSSTVKTEKGTEDVKGDGDCRLVPCIVSFPAHWDTAISLLTFRSVNKLLSSAKFLVCFNFQSDSKIGENIA